jgi:hypothetical protein
MNKEQKTMYNKQLDKQEENIIVEENDNNLLSLCVLPDNPG